jgi:beta-lactamase regulating signal transducer with metallopeptidase domain
VEILVNWLWQGIAVAVAAGVLLRIARRRVSATTRHQVWWAALAVVLLLPALPMVLAMRASVPVATPSNASATIHHVSDDVENPRAQLAASTPAIVLPSIPAWSRSLLFLAWAAYVTFSLLRIAAAVRSLRRVKRIARPFPEAREADLGAWLAVRNRGRAARLVVSDHVRAAAVLGLGSPMIAVAPDALDALSSDELDHIIVHEWAHVQRRDDISQLAQRIVVALAGLHPAVWWIDRQLAIERETACDDWAVNTKGSPKRLALSLTKLAELPRQQADPSLVSSALSVPELTTRVVRLLDGRRNTSTRRAFGVPAAAALTLLACAVGMSAVQLIATETVSAAVEREPESVVSQSAPSTTAAVHRKATLAATSNDTPVTPVRTSLRASEFRERPRPGRPSSARNMTRNEAAAPSASEGQQPSADSPAPRAAIAVTPGLDPSQIRSQELPGPKGAVGNDKEVEVTGSSNAAAAQQARMATPWGVAADAGVTVGKSSQKAAVATAGFFNRFGKSIAKVF